MTGLTPHQRMPRGFLYGAALAVLVFVALGLAVGSIVRSQEERAFGAAAAWAEADLHSLVDRIVLTVETQGATLLDRRQPEESPYVSRLVAWPGADVERVVAFPADVDIELDLQPFQDNENGRIVWVDGVYRLHLVLGTSLVAADLRLDALHAEVERLSGGLVGVGFTDPERDVTIAVPTRGGGDFGLLHEETLLELDLEMPITPGPNAAASGRDPIIFTFAAMGLICGGLVLAVGRSTAGRLADAEHRAQLLEEISEGKDRFIASVSHELRTPLAAIQGFSMELTDTIFDPVEHLEIARVIAEQSQEMGLLVEDLLVAGRVDAGTIVVEVEPMNLIDAIGASVAVISVPETKHVGLSLEPTWAMGDPLRVRQVVRNLLTNAIRYGGNEIEIVVRNGGRASIIEVIDNGPGIDVADPSVIFQPYYRLSDVKTMPASVGLGLTVARDLADLMGGSLGYSRSKNRTVFRLELAAAAQPSTGTPMVPTDAVA